MSEKYNWIHSRAIRGGELLVPGKISLEPKVDELVSRAIGKKVYLNDPRLLRLVASWQAQKKNPDEDDDFLNDPHKLQQLKETLI